MVFPIMKLLSEQMCKAVTEERKIHVTSADLQMILLITEDDVFKAANRKFCPFA